MIVLADNRVQRPSICPRRRLVRASTDSRRRHRPRGLQQRPQRTRQRSDETVTQRKEKKVAEQLIKDTK